jgi:DNA-binding winged helix-turn-helix (wHTH) protein
MDGLGSLDRFIFEDLRFDRAAGCLFRTNGSCAAEPVALGSRALALLTLLVERQGQLVSKDEIFAAVWPGTAVEEANLTVQISRCAEFLIATGLRAAASKLCPDAATALSYRSRGAML